MYPQLNQGGWLQSLVSALRSYAPSVELHIAAAGPKNRRVKIDGVSYYSLGSEFNGKILHRISPAFIRAADNLIAALNPDVIHFHGSEGLFCNIPQQIYADRKYVVSLQGILQGCYPHYVGGINELEIKKYRNYCNFLLTGYTITRGSESWRSRRGAREVEAFSKVKNVFGRTYWDWAWTRYLAPQARYFHVGEVLRPQFYTGMRDERQVRKHSIFCGGALAYPLKGGHWLLKAIANMKKRYPDIQLRVANASRIKPGKGIFDWVRRNEYQRYIWQIIMENDLIGNVALLPSLTAEEVADELRKAEVFCLPSLCENSPNSIGEAMMLGAPIIATNVGGISSIVKDNHEGNLVPSADPAILAAGIERIFEDRSHARNMQEAAYATAVTRYSHKAVVKQLISAYEDILKQ